MKLYLLRHPAGLAVFLGLAAIDAVTRRWLRDHPRAWDGA